MFGIGETEGQGWVSLTFGSRCWEYGGWRREGDGGEIVEGTCAAGRGMSAGP